MRLVVASTRRVCWMQHAPVRPICRLHLGVVGARDRRSKDAYDSIARDGGFLPTSDDKNSPPR